MLKLNSIYQGDCLELVKQIDDNSIDLIVCDGPYGVTNFEWDKITNIQEYNFHLVKTFSRVLRPGGSMYLFGKEDCLDYVDYRPYLTQLRKVVWYLPGRLAQGRNNYTNSSDFIIYLKKKGGGLTFNLEDIRVSQLVDAKQRKRVENVPSVRNGKYNKTKYNENGKNPGSVWFDIKQLTYKSKELLGKKYLNTIQKPESLIERLVKASSNPGDIVLDPFLGTGTTYAVCQKLKRNIIGFEMNPELIEVTKKRCGLE